MGHIFQISSQLIGFGTLAVAAACTAAPRPGHFSPPAGFGAPPECVVREVSRTPLTLEDGRHIYVAPSAFALERDGGLILAGLPNYILRSDTAGAGDAIDAANSVFGALIEDGEVHAIPAPIEPLRMVGIGVLARHDGGWDVVFAELAVPRPIEQRSSRDSVARLWHAVYRAGRWDSLDELPIPTGLTVSSAETAFAVARHGDTLAWAVGVLTARRRQAVLVLERREGAWHSQEVPTGSWVDLSLGYSADSTLLLAFIRPDPALRSDQNSLFVWARSPEWAVLRRVVLGSVDGPASSPLLDRWGPRTVLTWAAETDDGAEVHASLDLQRDSAMIVVDSAVEQMSPFASVPLTSGTLVWITEHENGPGRPSDLQVRAALPTGGAGAGRIENPFFANFRALPAPEGDVWLTGALADTRARTVTSLLLRLRLSCPGTLP